MTTVRTMLLGLTIASMIGLVACSGSSGGTGGGAGGGGGGGGGAGGGSGIDAGQCGSFTTPGAILLNAPTATGVTVVKKTPNHPALDGGLP